MVNKHTYDMFSDVIYEKVLDNGLTVYLLPKKDYLKTFALFTTNYGSIDNNFIPIGESDYITVPDGVAHFLEHKLFEKKDYDVFEQFLQYGASPNAYTSFTKTAYLFQATDHIKENVTILLDFVQEPYFSEQSVEKEKGIIAQEIKMYDDQIATKSYMATINNMFINNPVQTDIAGTVDSIQAITKEDLYTCFETFYHPNNMSFFMTGPFDPADMMAHIEENQAKKQFKPFTDIKRHFKKEPSHVKIRSHTVTHKTAIPNVSIGIKESTTSLEGDAFLKKDLLQSFVLTYLFSTSGPFYTELAKANLIDASFNYSTTLEKEFGFSIIQSNSHHPAALIDRMKQLLASTKSLSLTEEQFKTLQGKKIGQHLMMMNSLNYLANQFIHYKSVGVDFFDLVPFIESLTVKDFNEYLHDWIKEDNVTSLVIE